MSASTATRLRQLASQYHSGELNLQAYRQLRAELLDRLTKSNGDPEEAVTTLPQRTRPIEAIAAAAPLPAPAPVSKPAPVAAPPRQAPVEVMQSAAPPKPKRSPVLPVVIGLALLIAIAGGIYFYLHGSPGAESAGSVAEQDDTSSESYRAVDEFLSADDWSNDQIANFNARWATLPGEMRDAALQQSWYRNFVEQVRSRVKEQRALTASADSAGRVDAPLAALASSVGIDISQPDLVIPVHAPAATAESGQSHEKAAIIGAPTGGSSHVQPHAPAAAKASTPEGGAAAPASTAAAVKAANNVARPPATAADSKPAAPPVVAEADNPERCRLELVGSRRPRCHDALSIGGFGPYLAVIRKGTFDMGSKEVANEQPVHRVTIDKPFAIGEFEVSQGEYRQFCTATNRSCGEQPWQGDDFPVVRVSWQDARDYVAWLSRVTGKTYRLATEAEWEYAARSGGPALYPSGDSLAQTDAVFSSNEKLTAPWPRTRKINANAFRLYHTIGNVREWVEDAWMPTYEGAPVDGSARKAADAAQRVVRGGAYPDTAPKLRFTTRDGVEPGLRDEVTGFRVVREF